MRLRIINNMHKKFIIGSNKPSTIFLLRILKLLTQGSLLEGSDAYLYINFVPFAAILFTYGMFYSVFRTITVSRFVCRNNLSGKDAGNFQSVVDKIWSDKKGHCYKSKELLWTFQEIKEKF